MIEAAKDPSLGYPMTVAWCGEQVALWVVPLSLTDCMVEVDLRAGESARGDSLPADTVCLAGERIDPETDLCAPCQIDNPSATCMCGYETVAAPFPYCAGHEARAVCATTCSGDIQSCNAYTVMDGNERVSDCDLLRACCRALAAEPGATPCCPAGQSLWCFEGSGTPGWPYGYLCLSNDCCETPCTADTHCDTAFQTCEDHWCRPGCSPVDEYCHDGSTPCECLPL